MKIQTQNSQLESRAPAPEAAAFCVRVETMKTLVQVRADGHAGEARGERDAAALGGTCWARTEVELMAKPSMARRPRSLSPMVSSDDGSLSELHAKQLAALCAGTSVQLRHTANAASESADDSTSPLPLPLPPPPLPPLVPRTALDSVDTPGDPTPWWLPPPRLLPSDSDA